MTYLSGRPWFTSLMDKGEILGECANCKRVVRESLFTLDDCYGVYRGECPHCHAINLLDYGNGGIRGYSSREMRLTLPTDHEMKMNDWPEDVPTRKCDCKECRAVLEGFKED